MPEAGVVWAVVPAGGSGTRYSGSEDKLLVEIAGEPVLVRTLRALFSAPSIAGIVLVSAVEKQTCYQALIERYLGSVNLRFATGGRDRRESVLNGLLALPDTVEVVAIHDAARPLVQPAVIDQAVSVVVSGQAGAVVAVPVVDTLKQAEIGSMNICCTVDRAQLWRAQTPQVFRREVILRAHRAIALETPVTDDAQLMELAGLGPVVLVPGDEHNLKITTPADVALAEAFLASGSE
ncbi:MAG TPA: 2-C-methyl-D-erythritol 4-phosphate cytidylyltransferase [Coleofasciculaceae cyanobacterium]|jgi:2-C-methyl-D-erythritol 4-phosphate cytidylyltransferase